MAKKVSRAQRRVLRNYARYENELEGGWLFGRNRLVRRHDGEVLIKLARRGFFRMECRQYAMGSWVLQAFLTPKGWAASGVKREESRYER